MVVAGDEWGVRRMEGWNPDDVSDVGGCAEKMVLTGDYLASVT